VLRVSGLLEQAGTNGLGVRIVPFIMLRKTGRQLLGAQPKLSTAKVEDWISG
jgi:hypothetical protein